MVGYDSHSWESAGKAQATHIVLGLCLRPKTGLCQRRITNYLMFFYYQMVLKNFLPKG